LALKNHIRLLQMNLLTLTMRAKCKTTQPFSNTTKQKTFKTQLSQQTNNPKCRPLIFNGILKTTCSLSPEMCNCLFFLNQLSNTLPKILTLPNYITKYLRQKIIRSVNGFFVMKEEFKLNLNTHVGFVIQKIKQPEKNFNSTFHCLKF